MTKKRSNGLDTLRASAIVLVFMYHYMTFVSGEPTFGWASSVGWVGVDLFFVLSGYLIVNQVFSGLKGSNRLSVSAFYARRALRTWPVFWLVLAAYFLFPSAMGGRQPPPLWTFLLFVQNIQLHSGTAFSHAWSLCIEEQFYFILPLALLLALRIGRRRYQAWLLLIALVAIGITIRAALWSTYGREDSGNVGGYYPNIYYASWCRFDEFLPGIAVALIKNFHPNLWRRLMEHGVALFFLGLVAVAAALYGVLSHYHIEGYGYAFFMTAFGYSCIAGAFSLLVVSALSEQSPLHRVRIPGAYHLAIWSYSIYLSHKAVAHMIHVYASQHVEWLTPPFELTAIAVATLAVGAILYRSIELPIMNFRDRKFPTLFHSAQKPATAN